MTLLVAMNAKYIYNSLAISSIKAYCGANGTEIKTKEFTINNKEDDILYEIYKEKPDILGFSCYIWNINQIIDIIASVKKILPNTIIFLGGPEVSFEYEYLFDLGVDIICIGEGEKTVKELVDNLEKNGISNKLREVDGIVFRLKDDIIVNKSRELLDLNDIPFAYNSIEGLDIIYYEASRGCPYSCQYCLSSLEKKLRFLNEDRVKSDLDFFLKSNAKQVKFVDRTFNCNKKFAMFIWKYLIENDNNISNFHFEISAELLDDDMIELLSKARVGLFQFEIGVQSTNNQTLNEVKRKTNLEKLFENVRKVNSLKNVHQHLDLIAGLPYEDYDIFKKSFNDVFSLYPEKLQLGFLKLLKGSGLRENANKYGIVFKDKAPYEVIYTGLIDYKTMHIIKNVEEILETYYNSNISVNTIRYALKYFETPFDFFEKFSSYWEENGYFKVSHKKVRIYEIIYQFLLSTTGIDIDILKELIRFDMLLNDNIKTLPLWIDYKEEENLKYIEKDFYNKKENIEKYIPSLINEDKKQISRKLCKFDIFNINIFEMARKDFKEVVTERIYVLFDYYKKDILTSKAKTYEIERADIDETCR